MRKLWVVAFVLLIYSFSFASASFDSEVKALTYHAEEYETGNLNYPQLVVKLSSVRENLNRELGLISNLEGGVLDKDSIEDVLGKPTDMEKWIWVEGEDKERRLEKPVPRWRRVVFDGKKVRIRLEVHPSIFGRGKMQGDEELKDLEGEIVYRLHFNVEFKDSGDEVDFEAELGAVTDLAKKFNKDSSDGVAQDLAKQSVEAEMLFNEYFRQNEGSCEDIMVKLFGNENRRSSQKIIFQEYEFFVGDDFEVITRLEACEECEWQWVHLNMWIEGRGPNFEYFEEDFDFKEPRQMKRGFSNEEIKSEIESLVDSMRSDLEAGNYKKAMKDSHELRMLGEIWNEMSNDVWMEVEETFESKRDKMSEDERHKWDQNFGWIREDQERRKMVRDLQEENYEMRKGFYEDLFSKYPVVESKFEEQSWEKRLVENFEVFGSEVCDNNVDDNGDGNLDCADGQCSGQICGKDFIEEGNETIEVDLYCISNVCQRRDDSFEGAVCGNHVCETGEDIESCNEDCSACEVYDAIECDGKIIFSGVDEFGCNLEPICIEAESCQADEDCDFVCGTGSCVEGRCEVEELSGCDAACESGEERIQNCEGGERVVTEICDEGVWVETGLMCEVEKVGEEESLDDEVFADECSLVSDCGGENDVCSNGRCVTLPEKVEEEIDSEIKVEFEEDFEESFEEEEIFEEPEDENFIINFFASIITGSAVDDVEGSFEKEIEENMEEETLEELGEVVEEGSRDGNLDEVSSDEFIEPELFGEDFEKDKSEDEEKDRREREEKEMREEEKRRVEEEQKRCELDCTRPCVEKCIRESCGEAMDCDVDSEIKACESSCEPERSCIDKCVGGENWWQDYEEEHKVENGVFVAGGSCRMIQDIEEGNIWFGGWGDPFDRIDRLKDKYYRKNHGGWCEEELERSVKRRAEFEEGFDEEFLRWFFEKYLANSAEDWEQAQSGIYELYWNNVDNLRRIAENMRCVKTDDMSELMDYELINISYDTEYGRLEYWEELMEVKLDGMKNEVTIISPYMKVWIFPTEEFIKYEMKQAMVTGEFPGSSEDKMKRDHEGSLSREEREFILKDKKVMKKIRKISEEYDDGLEMAVKFVDGEELIFNLFVEVNEDDLFKMVPRLPNETGEVDVTVEVDYNLIYEMIENTEKEMKEAWVESPPWDRRDYNDRSFVGGAVDGIRMYFKIRKIVNSAEYEPKSSKGDVKDLFWIFADLMRGGDGDEKSFSEEEMKDLKKDSLSEEEIEEIFNRKN